MASWSWGLGANSSSSSHLDVDGVDADDLEFFGDVSGGKHGCVWGRFLSISSYFHTTGNLAVGFSSGLIGNVDESVIESGENVAHSELGGVQFELWWTVVYDLLFFGGFSVRVLSRLYKFRL